MHISLTTVVRPVTIEHTKRLSAYNIEHGDRTKQAVLNTIKWVGRPVSPHEITDIFYSNIHSELNHEYESGRISKKKLNKNTREQAITIRTVHRKLSSLVREGLLHRASGKYELTSKAKSDVRYFAQEVGNDILTELMYTYIPAAYSLEKNVDFMVRLFGVYLLFCFIETARPVSHVKENDQIYGPSKHEVISSCLQHLVRVEDMFDYFLSTLDYLTSDDDAMKRKYHKDRLYSNPTRFPNLVDCSPKPGPPSALEIKIMHKTDIVEKARPLVSAIKRKLKETGHPMTPPELNRYDLEGYESSRELGEDKINAFKKALSRACPDIYPRLAEMTSVLKESPRQKLKLLRESWEPLFPK
jgi:hypothetical protein